MSVDNSILKSLVDKEITATHVNPTLVINKQSKDIKDKIKALLAKSNRVDIAVSYVVWSGLSLIFNELAKFDSKSRIIITIDGFVTDTKSLKKLLNLPMQVKVFAPTNKSKGFHLKSYLFETKQDKTLLVGSANISSRAFGLAHEMAVEINASEKGQIVDEYKETFEDLWLDKNSVELDENFINWYEQERKENKQNEKKINEYIFNQSKIKPNYMQKQALEELVACRVHSNRGLVIAATGTGKTYLSAFDVKQSKAKKVLFMVHNRLILTSAIATYEKVFPNREIIELNSSNIEAVNNADMIFTTDKTVSSHLVNKLSNHFFDYIVYDEAHKIGDKTKYNQIIDYFTPKFSLGITATPERTDKPEFLFEKFKYTVPYEIRLLEAMNNELVCPFHYYGLNLEDELLESGEQFDYAELARYLKSQINTKSHYGEKLRCIVFCQNRNEAINLSQQLTMVGYNSKAVVSGNKTKREDIDNYIESLKSETAETIEILCTVNQFNEGIDIPDINTIVMLRNTESAIIYLQQLGRGLRKTDDIHKYVTVFDIIGNSKNNYSIAQVLTGNETADKRLLYLHANNNFNTVSPFINVEMEEKAMEKVIQSISNNFTVKKQLKDKFKNELSRYEVIPSLLEMYLNPNFNELELVQLLNKNFYNAFEKYYEIKYKIELGHKFVKDFFTLITQFVFRGYSKETLRDYANLLKGNAVENELLARVLIPRNYDNGISTAINSEYNMKGKNYVEPFVSENGKLSLNSDISAELRKCNALGLFEEHVELFEHLANCKSYVMKPFDLVTKGEFLFNAGSGNCYMHMQGEYIDKQNKVIYCVVKVTKKESHYDNYILDDNKIVYHTQNSNTEKQATEKMEMLLNDGYKFKICAQFPHLGYCATAHFNLGNVRVVNVSEAKENIVYDKNKKPLNKYNHEVVLELENNIPVELLQYKL